MIIDIIQELIYGIIIVCVPVLTKYIVQALRIGVERIDASISETRYHVMTGYIDYVDTGFVVGLDGESTGIPIFAYVRAENVVNTERHAIIKAYGSANQRIKIQIFNQNNETVGNKLVTVDLYYI